MAKLNCLLTAWETVYVFPSSLFRITFAGQNLLIFTRLLCYFDRERKSHVILVITAECNSDLTLPVPCETVIVTLLFDQIRNLLISFSFPNPVNNPPAVISRCTYARIEELLGEQVRVQIKRNLINVSASEVSVSVVA
jgi:hypothetical protein